MRPNETRCLFDDRQEAAVIITPQIEFVWTINLLGIDELNIPKRLFIFTD
jgi:hypothetical protein